MILIYQHRLYFTVHFLKVIASILTKLKSKACLKTIQIVLLFQHNTPFEYFKAAADDKIESGKVIWYAKTCSMISIYHYPLMYNCSPFYWPIYFI